MRIPSSVQWGLTFGFWRCLGFCETGASNWSCRMKHFAIKAFLGVLVLGLLPSFAYADRGWRGGGGWHGGIRSSSWHGGGWGGGWGGGFPGRSGFGLSLGFGG